MTFLDRRLFMMGAATSMAALHGQAAFAARKPRVVVVGAGIMGASIAYHLAQRGALVTILDQAGPAAGATRNSFAWLNTYLKSPHPYYQLNMAGIMDWRRLALEIGPALRVQWGGSVAWSVTDDDAAKLQAQVAQRESFGDPIRPVDAEDLSALLPGVAIGSVKAGAFASIEGTLDPVEATEVLLSEGRKMGVKLVSACQVSSFRRNGAKVAGVITNHGEMAADYCVLAAGIGTMALAQQLGIAVPLVNKPGILAHSKPLPPLLRRVVVLPIGPGMGIKQNPDGRVVTGGHFGNNGDVEPTRELGDKMFAAAARYLPALKGATLDYMTLGHSVMPKDGLPIVGTDQRHPNLFVAAMDSGVTLAALMGRLAGIELLDGVATDLLEPFRPARFGAA